MAADGKACDANAIAVERQREQKFNNVI